MRYGFDQRIGNIALVAAANRYGPEELLTWGVLREGVEVLKGRYFPMSLGCGFVQSSAEFMEMRPFAMQGELSEGLVGRGIPVGGIEIKLWEPGGGDRNVV